MIGVVDSPVIAAIALDSSATNGWDPFTPFSPQTDFSKSMLQTIPKKVSSWLQLLGKEVDGEYGSLKWHYTPENGTIIYEKADQPETYFQLWWAESGISATDQRVERIEDNMDFFVEIERMIYDELEQLQKEIHDRTAPERFLKEHVIRNFPTSETDVVQSEEA